MAPAPAPVPPKVPPKAKKHPLGYPPNQPLRLAFLWLWLQPQSWNCLFRATPKWKWHVQRVQPLRWLWLQPQKWSCLPLQRPPPATQVLRGAPHPMPRTSSHILLAAPAEFLNHCLIQARGPNSSPLAKAIPKLLQPLADCPRQLQTQLPRPLPIRAAHRRRQHLVGPNGRLDKNRPLQLGSVQSAAGVRRVP